MSVTVDVDTEREYSSILVQGPLSIVIENALPIMFLRSRFGSVITSFTSLYNTSPWIDFEG